MKTHIYLFLLIFSSSLLSCDNKDYDGINNPEVEMYIRQLKSNQYDSRQLPTFSYKDIPALLAYRNETRTISDFPRNPISSLFGPECSLGMYVLWTIESIRAEAIQSKFLMMGFPSQNPILARRDPVDLVLVFDNLSHSTAAKAYFDWWKNNKNKDFDKFNTIDPLEKTDYRWH